MDFYIILARKFNITKGAHSYFSFFLSSHFLLPRSLSGCFLFFLMISSQAQHQFSRPLNAPIHPPSASRPNAILGGPEHLPDETGERIKEDFLTFLQRCRDQGNGNVGILSSIPTSEMLTTSNGSAVGSNYLFPSEPPTLQGVDSSQMMIGTNQQLAMPIYVQQLHEMRNEGQSTLYIDFAHLMAYNDVLATAILDNFYR